MARKWRKSVDKYDMNLWSFRIEVSILQPKCNIHVHCCMIWYYDVSNWTGDNRFYKLFWGKKRKKSILVKHLWGLEKKVDSLATGWSVLSTSTYPKSSQRPVICFDRAKAPRGNLSTKGFKTQFKSPPTIAFSTARSDNLAKASVKKLSGWHGGQ